MKIIKYILSVKTNIGTKEEPVWEISEGGNVEIRCTESNLAANEEIAKKEAYNGEYTIEDDGQGEQETPITLENRVDALETDTADLAEALDMILSGVTE